MVVAYRRQALFTPDARHGMAAWLAAVAIGQHLIHDAHDHVSVGAEAEHAARPPPSIQHRSWW